ncbi:MAG: polysaccharide deacetylase family protein [Melioribacteraceae bacterium]|nr:polysaccharide deacetylase family protein [Melioribacteraceae bacterium]
MVRIKKEWLLFFFLLAGCNNNSVSPEAALYKGVCLTFDDTYVDQWYNISQLFLENEIQATFFVTKINSLPQSNLSKLEELHKAGFEIGSHGYNHLNANDYLQNHTLDEYYENEILPSIKGLESLNIPVKSFSYPYGMNNDSLDTFLLQYFDVLRDITDEQRKPLDKEVDKIEEIYFTKGDKPVISSLGIDNNFKIDLENLKKALERADRNNEVLILYAHCPVDSDPIAYQITDEYLSELIKLIKEAGLKTYTCSDLVK